MTSGYLTMRNVDRSATRRDRTGRSCLLLAPRRQDLESLHQTIKSASSQAGFRLLSSNGLRIPQSGIAEAIFPAILDADLIIAVAAETSPNVAYEVGFAHATGKPVLLLVDTQNATRHMALNGENFIPFDH